MRFYVYDLVDPRTGETFYVGKGCGRRAYQHAKDEIAGRIVNLAKSQRLEEIRTAGLQVDVRMIAEGLEETEAYRQERERILTLPGLTNYSTGQMTDAERAAAQCSRFLQRVKPFDQWVSEAPRSDYDVKAYGEIVTALHEMAEAA